MKISESALRSQLFFLLTHFAAGAVSAIAFGVALFLGDPRAFAIGCTISLISIVATAMFSAWRLKRGLVAVESVLADYQNSENLRTGLLELDLLARQLAKNALHWETIAANTRDQVGEFQTMMTLLDRRGQGESCSQQLRGALTGLGRLIHGHFAQLHQGAGEIENFAKSITDRADFQGNAVIKTTSYVEQLSTTIDTVAGNAALAQTAFRRTVNSAATALQLLNELNLGMKRLKLETESCEKKLKGLCDPARQVSAIVETISEIAARTNLLALNAAIESIRAGEHGRGFALVADEVRNLADQASDATREISNLMDSMQLATQETIRSVEREREQVDAEVQRAASAEHALREIAELGKDTRSIEQITECSSQQLQLAQGIILAIEQISGMAKANREKAESVSWTMKALANVNPHITKLIDRLRKCSGEDWLSQDSTSAIPVILQTSAPAAHLSSVG